MFSNFVTNVVDIVDVSENIGNVCLFQLRLASAYLD